MAQVSSVAGAPASAAGRLDSWKEIAAYFGRSERTVRRWEENEGLPIHRLQHEKRGSVYAYTDELDGWREARNAAFDPDPPQTKIRLAEIAMPAPRRKRWPLPAARVAALALLVTSLFELKHRPDQQVVPTAHHAVNSEAYDAYLKGRHFWSVSGEPDLKKSRAYFEQAIAKDPDYAPAWSGLADAYNRLASWGVLPSQDARPRARAAAEKALELDSTLVEPLLALADVKLNYEWDWAGAERLCKRVIQLDPKSGEAHELYAVFLAEIGRTQEAVRETRKAYELEPLSDVYAANVCWKLYLDRRYHEAEEWHKRSGCEQPCGDYILASVYLQQGHNRQALAELRKAVTLPWAGALEMMYLAHGLGVTGARAEGEKVVQKMLALAAHQRYIPPEYVAIAYEGLGQRSQAIEWFEKAYAERSMNGWLLPDPRLNDIRADPRFKQILQRMGLPI